MKCNVLWVSTVPPVKTLAHAGGVNFRQDFYRIANDSRFNVFIVSKADINAKDEIEEELKWVKHEIFYTGKSFKEMAHKIINLESKYNLWNRNAGLISNYCEQGIIKSCREVKSHFNPDIVILEWTDAVVLVESIKKIFPGAKYLAKEHDVTYIGYGRKKDYYTGIKHLIWTIKYTNEKKVELKALKACDVVVPHNPDNFDVLESDGVKREKLYWYVPYYKNMGNCVRHPNKRDILFYGAMARPENYLSCQWFVEKVMPLLTEYDVRFVVLGSNPPDEIKNLESNNIHITGFVEDTKPFFEESMCFVAPLVLGAGIKIKVLEAISSGITVLTNDLGIEGIRATDRVHFFLCKEAEEYAKVIKQIITNEVDVNEMEINARKLSKEYDTELSFRRYMNMILKMCSIEN